MNVIGCDSCGYCYRQNDLDKRCPECGHIVVTPFVVSTSARIKYFMVYPLAIATMFVCGWMAKGQENWILVVAIIGGFLVGCYAWSKILLTDQEHEAITDEPEHDALTGM